jgi:hypothetical protein
LGDRGARHSRLGHRIGIILLGDRLHLGERGKTADALVGRLRGGARTGKVRRRLIDRGLIEAGVDLVERLAGADKTTLGKQAAADQAVHLRPHFAGFERHGPPAERGGDRYRLDLCHDKADLRRAAAALAIVVGL